MSDSQGQSKSSKSNKQPSNNSNDASLVRRSKRPLKPSNFYTDGFEDTQKVIGNFYYFERL